MFVTDSFTRGMESDQSYQSYPSAGVIATGEMTDLLPSAAIFPRAFSVPIGT